MRRQMHQASKTGLATATMQSPHRTYPDTHGEEPLVSCWRLRQPHNLPPLGLGTSECVARPVTTSRGPMLQWRDRSVPWCGGVALGIGSTHTWHTHTQEHWHLALRRKETNARTHCCCGGASATNQLGLMGGRHLGGGDSGQAHYLPAPPP